MKLEQIADASKTVSLEVGDNEARVLRFREEKIAELVSKVREKNEGPPSAATLRQTRAACAELDKELTDLRAYQARISVAPRSSEGTYPNHGPPVGGPIQYAGVHTVVHAAGTLSDGLIIPNAGELARKFQSVYESKAHAAWHIMQNSIHRLIIPYLPCALSRTICSSHA